MESKTRTKRVCTTEPKNDIAPTRSWDAMIPEILSLIFKKIVPLEEMLRTVSLVCRGWLETVAGPYCWNEIDVEHWCRSHWNSCNAGNRRDGLLIDSIVRKLVRRSKFTVRKFCACRLGNAGFPYVANCGRCLKVLKIPVSEITDQVVEKHAEFLVNLTELDISYCLKLTSKSLQAFGKHCKFLTHLKRNMPPMELGPVVALETDDDEAFMIANTMAGLDHLELGFARVTDHGLSSILTACKALTYLDIQGCWNIRLGGGGGGGILKRDVKSFWFSRLPGLILKVEVRDLWKMIAGEMIIALMNHLLLYQLKLQIFGSLLCGRLEVYL